MGVEETILALLAQREPGRTICPSEAARAEGVSMAEARAAAARLVAAGKIDVTQRGEVVDLATARGPIRLRAR